MLFRNEIGGSTVIDERDRRWLIVILAFVLAAAGLFFGAPASHANETVGHASFSLIDPYCEEVEGQAGFVDVRVMNDEDDGLGDMDLIELRLYAGDDGWYVVDTIDDDGDPLEDPIAEGAQSEVYTFYDLDIDSTPYRVEADVEWYDGESLVEETITSSSFTVPECEEDGTFFNCGEVSCSNIPDPFGENWVADVDCDGCTVLIRDPGTNPDGSEGFADIEVSGTDLKVRLTATGKGTPPGKAAVWADDALLPKCKGKNATDCVKIKRIKGAHTYYDVRVGEDPRFRFR